MNDVKLELETARLALEAALRAITEAEKRLEQRV